MKKKEGAGYLLVLVATGVAGYMIYSQGAKLAGQESVAVTSPTVAQKVDNNQQAVGKDKDEHGCIASAGYTWCAAKNKCLRSWEEKCEAEDKAATDQLVYVNDKYGFQLTLAPGWEKYKVVEYDSDPTSVSVHILLPTSDQSWTGVLDSDQQGTIAGYADMLTVVVENLDGWTDNCTNHCDQQDPTLDCASCNDYIAKTAEYVYSFSGPQDLPADLRSLRAGSVDGIEKSFKLSNQ